MLREIRRRLAEDPLLKVGVVAMTFALALTGVAALIVFLDGPPRAVAAKSSGESPRWPLARSAPDTDWWNWGDPLHQRHRRSPGADTESPPQGRRRIKAAKPSPLMIMITHCQPIGNSGPPTNQDATTSLPGPS